MTDRVSRQSGLRPLWAWGLAVFLSHGALVFFLIKIRDLKPGGALWNIARLALHLVDFWVYQWIIWRFNTPALAEPMYQFDKFFGISTLQGSAQLFEFFIDFVFGGIVYGALAMLWLYWRRSREGRSELQSAVA